MVSNPELTQNQVQKLLDDTAYLQDEAEALKYVIEQVPYSEEPPGGRSIYSMLRLIDHAQVNYYRPLIEKIFSENRVIKLSDFESYESTFDRLPEEEKTEEKEHNTDRLLSKIIKHRAALLNTLRKFTLIDWERKVKDRDENEITLFDFVRSLVSNERGILKDVADLVLIYQNEKLSRREINARAEQRKQ
jgi:hypothetical protein